MPTKDPTHLAWFDMETTGLHLENDYVIEAALMVTDMHLYPQHDPWHSPVAQGLGWLTMLERNEYVDNMHVANGLKAELMRGEGLSYADTDMTMASILGRYAEPGCVWLAGSGVAAFDLPRVQKWFPLTASFMQYKTLDIGHMRRFIQTILQRPDLAPENDTHRALPDMEGAYRMALQYRTLFGSLVRD